MSPPVDVEDFPTLLPGLIVLDDGGGADDDSLIFSTSMGTVGIGACNKQNKSAKMMQEPLTHG